MTVAGWYSVMEGLPPGWDLPVENADDEPLCWHARCWATYPRHAIVWKCPAGHRGECWYCDTHIGGQVEHAEQVLSGVETRPVPCSVCSKPMLPLVER